ncbi:MAG: DPP IV N-terminal domain-containing protein [bacterium]
MKTNQTLGLCGAIILFTLTTSCADKTRPDNEIGQPAGTAVQTGKKTVVQDLCWSPDGRYVYFSAMKVKPDFSDYSPELWTVYRFDANTRSTEVVVKSALNVAVSPAGTHLAVAKNEGDKRNLYLVEMDGKNPTPLIAGDTKISGPSWSHDGQRIAFSSTMSGAQEIYTANQDGTNVMRLTESQGHSAYNPAWSPDGMHIAYYLEKGDGQDQVHIMKADGTEDRNITNDTSNNIFPGWIDNSTIIYGQGHKNAPTKAYQISIDGTNKKQVLQIESMYARYSPDGSKIAYINETAGIIEVVTSTGESLYRITVAD